jgi:ParB family chromosome partitioning protein
MPKASRDKTLSKGKVDVYMFDPDDVKLVTKEGDPLYDKRAEDTFDEGLVLNMLHCPDGETPQGVLKPTLGRRNTETAEIEITDGRRRTLALREANKRLRKEGASALFLPVWIRRMNDSRAVAALISTNEHSKEDTPLGRAMKAARYIELGHTEKECAALLNTSEATVKNLLHLLDAPAAIRNAANAGKINVSDAYKLAREEPEQAKKKLTKLLEHAPRQPGKKRSRNAGKAREIMGRPPAPAPAGKKSKGNKEPEFDVASFERADEKYRRKIEDQAAERIAAWIEENWNSEGAWAGAPSSIPEKLRKGDWREPTDGVSRKKPEAAEPADSAAP